MKFLLSLILIIICYVIWQYFELKKFRVKEYTIHSPKITEPLTAVVIADLHCHEYGRENERLLAAVRECTPDIILVPGDMIVSSHTEKYPIAEKLYKKLAQTAPVYFSNGNHEQRIDTQTSQYYEPYHQYKESVKKSGVTILKNEQKNVQIKNDNLLVCGVDIPLECYEKGHIRPLPENFLSETLGNADENRFHILLAHNPAYSDDYAAWGADVTVSGHTHGGLVRIPGIGSVISPQFEWFPKYDSGRFTINGNTVIVSRGLGTHTFHIRVFDRAELVVLHLEP